MKHLAGKFIVLDGGEGCGKSTQAALLRDAVQQAGVPCLLVRDPGATRTGELIRNILLDPANTDIAMRCEMLLYMAARAQMMRELIAPALDGGNCVISDRFISSTLAYQLGGDGMTGEEIRQVGGIAINGRWPDLTIILDMPAEKTAPRLKPTLDRIERRPPEYHRIVRDNFLSQASADPRRVRLIDADRPVQAVHRDIVKLLAEFQPCSSN